MSANGARNCFLYSATAAGCIRYLAAACVYFRNETFRLAARPCLVFLRCLFWELAVALIGLQYGCFLGQNLVVLGCLG